MKEEQTFFEEILEKIHENTQNLKKELEELVNHEIDKISKNQEISNFINSQSFGCKENSVRKLVSLIIDEELPEPTPSNELTKMCETIFNNNFPFALKLTSNPNSHSYEIGQTLLSIYQNSSSKIHSLYPSSISNNDYGNTIPLLENDGKYVISIDVYDFPSKNEIENVLTEYFKDDDIRIKYKLENLASISSKSLSDILNTI